jgi:hypothetical protein
VTRLVDIVGQRFGRLVVLRRAPTLTKPAYLVRCDCGTEKIIRGDHLRAGRVKACGADMHRQQHGQTASYAKTAEYTAWSNMVARCRPGTHPHTGRYGARGITICKQWRDSFEAFFADVGKRPSPQHSLDRINNDGDYEPGNVRWATRAQQQRNTRKTIFLVFDNERLPVSVWAERLGISRSKILWRARNGYPIEQILSTDRAPRRFRANGQEAR